NSWLNPTRLLAGQFFDPNIPPADFQRLGFGADLMDLEGDKSFWRHIVLEINRRYAVDPGLDGVALALDAERIPLALLESLAGGFIVRQVGQKSAAPGFVVDRAAVRPIGWIDFHLIAVNAVGRELFLFPLDVDFGLLLEDLAADLNARVEFWIDFELHFEYEIAILLLGAQE